MTHQGISDNLNDGAIWLSDLQEDTIKATEAITKLLMKNPHHEFRQVVNMFCRNAKENLRGFIALIDSYPETPSDG